MKGRFCLASERGGRNNQPKHFTVLERLRMAGNPKRKKYWSRAKRGTVTAERRDEGGRGGGGFLVSRLRVRLSTLSGPFIQLFQTQEYKPYSCHLLPQSDIEFFASPKPQKCSSRTKF